MSSDLKNGGRWLLLPSLAVALILACLAWQSPPAVGDDAGDEPVPELTEDAAEGNDDPASSDAASTEPQSAAPQTNFSWDEVWYPLLTLGVGVFVVLGLIIGFRVNAFIALITAAIVVSLMAPGGPETQIGRVAKAFGDAAGGIAIVIALAAVIGKCMLDSGAADRIVRVFSNLLGEQRAPFALMGSGFVLAVPVFFDTVFYLLVPLARSLYRKTNRNYLKYILAIGVGGAITHTLVPPTPGPLLMASNLSVDVGYMIMVGTVVAIPAALVGLMLAHIVDKIMPIPMRPVAGQAEVAPLKDEELPSIGMSLLPVVLPVILISSSTVATTIADAEHAAHLTVTDINDWSDFASRLRTELDDPGKTPAKQFFADDEEGRAAAALLGQAADDDAAQAGIVAYLNQRFAKDKYIFDEEAFVCVLLNDVAKSKLGGNRVRMKEADAERMNRALLESTYPDMVQTHIWETPKRKVANWSALFGNANLALLLSTVVSLWMLVSKRNLTLKQLGVAVEEALMSGGVIILITAAGGAFGSMLAVAKVGGAIEQLFGGSGDTMSGSSLLVLGFLIAVVLKIAQGSSTVAMIVGSGMVAAILAGKPLDFHPVYIATAIGGGSLVGSWMNDSGFWIFAKMGGLTEAEALKSWTVLLTILGVTSFACSLLLAHLLPLTSG